MKIYFEDGELRHSTQLPFKADLRLEANLGVSQNLSILDELMKKNPNAIVYTNSILAFNNIYAWNEKLKVPEIYIRAGEHMIFTRIDKLTEKEIHWAHNLEKMYLAGTFE